MLDTILAPQPNPIPPERLNPNVFHCRCKVTSTLVLRSYKDPMKEQYVSANERQFILSAVKDEKIRIDGRTVHDFRDIDIIVGPDRGQSEVCFGNTRVAAFVSAEIVEPFPDRPTEGFLSFVTELSPMASPYFEEGNRSSPMKVEIERLVERAIRKSRAMDTEALCIVAGSKVWSVTCKISVLDYHGNLIDCVMVAVMSALLHFRREDITVVGDKVTVHPEDEREPVPLSIHHIPVCISFALFDKGEVMMVDPSLKEDLIMEGRLTVALNTFDEICLIHKAGGIAIEFDQILRCTQIAAHKSKEISKLITDTLEQWENKINNIPEPKKIGAAAEDEDHSMDDSGNQDDGDGDSSSEEEDVEMFSGGSSKWVEAERKKPVNNNNNSSQPPVEAKPDEESDSEEEEAMVLEGEFGSQRKPEQSAPAPAKPATESPKATKATKPKKKKDAAADDGGELDLSAAIKKKKKKKSAK